MKYTMRLSYLFCTMLFLALSFSIAFGVENAVQEGMDHLASRNYKAAIKKFNLVIRSNPTNHQAYLGRGIARYYRGKYDKAIEDFNRTIENNPKFAKAHIGRGMVWYRMGEYKRAIADYRLALDLEPHNPKTMNQLAWTLAVSPDKNARDPKRAVGLAKNANGLDTRSTYLDTLAAAYAASGKFGKAVETQKQAITMMVETNQEKDLQPYLDRLKSYQNKKPWRDGQAPEKTALSAESDISEKPETKDTTPQAENTEAGSKDRETNQKEGDDHQKLVAKSESRPPASIPSQVAESAETQTPAVTTAPATTVESATPADSVTTTDTSTTIDTAKSEAPAQIEAPPEAAASTGAETQKVEVAKPAPSRVIASLYPYPYTVLIGEYQDPHQANAAALKFRKKGDPAFVSPVTIDGAVLYRMFMGVYENKGQAEAAAMDLKRRSFRRTDVVEQPYGIQVGVFKTVEAIERAEEILLAKGLLGYRIPLKSGKIRFLIGAWETENVPQSLMETIKEKGFSPVVVMR